MVVAFLSPPYDLELEGLGLYKKGPITICNLEEGQGSGLQMAVGCPHRLSPCDMYKIESQYEIMILH